MDEILISFQPKEEIYYYEMRFYRRIRWEEKKSNFCMDDEIERGFL